jgi:hypothetical protein
MRRLLFTCAILLTGVTAMAQQAEDRTKAPEQAVMERNKAQMEKMAKESVGLAVKALSSGDGLYPFALTMTREGDISLSGYSGEPDQAPPAEEWTQTLMRSLQTSTGSKRTLVAASLVRLMTVEDEKTGESVPGIWVMVDHRGHRPWVMLFPLIKTNEGNKRKVGNPAYYATDQWLFSEQNEKDPNTMQ